MSDMNRFRTGTQRGIDGGSSVFCLGLSQRFERGEMKYVHRYCVHIEPWHSTIPEYSEYVNRRLVTDCHARAVEMLAVRNGYTCESCLAPLPDATHYWRRLLLVEEVSWPAETAKEALQGVSRAVKSAWDRVANALELGLYGTETVVDTDFPIIPGDFPKGELSLLGLCDERGITGSTLAAKWLEETIGKGSWYSISDDALTSCATRCSLSAEEYSTAVSVLKSEDLILFSSHSNWHMTPKFVRRAWIASLGIDRMAYEEKS